MIDDTHKELTNAAPFRLILELKTPYIPPATTPSLDGILWGALSRSLGQPASVPLDAIPLTRSHGVFHGSRAVASIPAYRRENVTFFRSFNREREQMPGAFFDKKRRPHFAGYPDSEMTKDIGFVVNGISKGFFKTLMNTYEAVTDQFADRDSALLRVAFFGHGDLERVRTLLRFLPGIGRKVRQGYGLIGDVRIEAIETDLSLVLDGRPMRPIPVDAWVALGGDPALAARPMSIAPPYLVSPHIMAVAPEGSLFVRVPEEVLV